MAIDKKEAADSLFGHIKKTTTENEKKQPSFKTAQIAVTEQKPASAEPVLNTLESKWKNHEKITVVLTFQQREALDRLAKQIMRNRPKYTFQQVADRERITTNTLIRSIIDIFVEEGPFSEPPEINTEKEVKQWLREVFIR